MNYHPFELKIEQLEAINKELETISQAEAAKTNGGLTITTGFREAGIYPQPPIGPITHGHREAGISPQPPLLATTACVGEEAGYCG